MMNARWQGVDIDPKALEQAHERVAAAGCEDLVEIINADITKKVDCVAWESVTVLFMFLGVASNLIVRDLVLPRLQPGTRIVSPQFQMPDWPEDEALFVPDATQLGTSIEPLHVYMWRVRHCPSQLAGGRVHASWVYTYRTMVRY